MLSRVRIVRRYFFCLQAPVHGGFLLVELLVALCMLTLFACIGARYAAASIAQRADALQYLRVTTLARTILEEVRAGNSLPRSRQYANDGMQVSLSVIPVQEPFMELSVRSSSLVVYSVRVAITTVMHDALPHTFSFASMGVARKENA